MGTNDYNVAAVDAIFRQALSFSQNHETKYMSGLLQGIASRHDYPELVHGIGNVLLGNDFVTQFCLFFEPGYFSNWCQRRMRYMIRHCPDTFSYWTNAPTTRLGTRVGLVANALSSMSEDDCHRVLRGEVYESFSGYASSKPQNLLHGLLVQNAENWRDVSLHWVSTSELREAAVAIGWGTKYLSAMVHRNILVAGSEKWLSSVDYPYTLSAAMGMRIEGFIQAYVVMDNLEQLALELSNGGGPRLHAEEMLILPELGSPELQSM